MAEKDPKKEKYDFERMKVAATHKDRAVRKKMFIDYFERFHEFPSYLFDNETGIDAHLHETMQDLLSDPLTEKPMLEGVKALMLRLPPPTESAA
jgi:hypothetical protein